MSVKLVRIIARLNVGGPSVHCLTLSQKLTEKGYKTLLVTGTVEEGEENFETLFAHQHQAIGYHHLRLSSLKRSLGVLSDVVSFFRILKILLKVKPQIVHTHTAKAGALGRLAAVIAGVPVVIHTFHGHVLSGYFPEWFSGLIRFFERFLAKKTTVIVTLSPGLKKELVETFHIASSDKVQVVPLGRNLSGFFKSEHFKGKLKQELEKQLSQTSLFNQQTRIITIVGRLIPIKNHSLFLHALSLMKINVPWHAVIVGEGPMHEEIKRNIDSLKLTQKVTFLGWRSDLENIYANSDVVVCSSINEGTPLSIIESFASGTPVISTKVGGVADMFTNPTTDLLETLRPESSSVSTEAQEMVIKSEGILVENHKPKVLASAIELILSKDIVRKTMSKNAQAAALKYTDESLTTNMDKLYKELLEAKAA